MTRLCGFVRFFKKYGAAFHKEFFAAASIFNMNPFFLRTGSIPLVNKYAGNKAVGS